jgi:Family of unknown function (DUF5994)
MALSGTYDINANPASAADQIAPPVTRLSLDRATLRQAGIHGGWWPRSRDAAAELPGLLSELNTHAGRVSRVALQAGAFSDIPHQLVVGGHKVHVAWFRYMNPHTAILTVVGRDDLILLVVPPQASPEAAAQALRLAASGHQAGGAQAILAAAGIAAEGDHVMPARSAAGQKRHGRTAGS